MCLKVNIEFAQESNLLRLNVDYREEAEVLKSSKTNGEQRAGPRENYSSRRLQIHFASRN